MPTDIKATQALLDALAWAAGRPGQRAARAIEVHDAMTAGLLTGRPGGFDLTDAGRQLLDEHSQPVAGWARPGLKVIDAKHAKYVRARIDHHFTGTAGDPMESTCGAWRLPAGGWVLPHYPKLTPEPTGTGCASCSRLLARRRIDGLAAGQ